MIKALSFALSGVLLFLSHLPVMTEAKMVFAHVVVGESQGYTQASDLLQDYIEQTVH
jgi:hypothetical protein